MPKMHRPTWPHTVWRRDKLWYQRRAPRDCIAAFRGPTAEKPEDPVRFSLGVTLVDAVNDWPRVDTIFKQANTRFDRWISLAANGNLNWPQAKLEDDVRRMDEFLAKRLERYFPDRRIVVTEADQTMLHSYQQLAMRSYADTFGPLGFTVVEEVEHPVAAPLVARVRSREVRLEKDANQPCSILVETYIREMGPGKRETEIRLAVKRFVDAVGDKAQKDVDEFDVSKFYKFLDSVKNDRGGREFISVETQKKTKAQVCSFFSWGRQTMRYATPNPFKGDVKLQNPERQDGDEDYAESYTLDELNKVFRSAFFTGCLSEARPYAPGLHLIRDHRFWFPIVALHSFARRSELTQLEFQDIVELYGRPTFGFNLVSRYGHRKRLKTKSSARLVPIHRTLIELGFLDWVAKRKLEATDGRVFPRFDYSKWWNETLTRHPSVDIWVYRRKTLHSLRHCGEDALRDATTDKTGRDRLMGHEIPGMSESYGEKTGPLGVAYKRGVLRKDHAAIIDRIAFPGLILPAQ